MTERKYTPDWITEVRGGTSKIEFGKHVYVYKKNGSQCVTVHRNTIGNWESGKTELPRDLETFLSIALFDYDNHVSNSLDVKTMSQQERNHRYFYARECMKDMLEVDLYCRHLHDALLIEVCRGIFNFEEVPALERKLEEELKKVPLTVQEKNKYAIERNTVAISDDLNKVTSKEEFVDVVTKIHRNSFASANRIVGARMRDIYSSRERYGKEHSLGRAIANLAPNYRDSYVRMFKSSFISRKWMIDLCRHLRFDEEEIARVLESAHMAPLSEKELELWPDARTIIGQKNLSEKFKIIFLLGIYVMNRCCVDECPPVDYLLESFAVYDQGRRVMNALDAMLEKKETRELGFEELWEKLEQPHGAAWISYINLDNAEVNYDEDLQARYKEEKPDYYYMLPKAVREIRHPDEAELMHYLFALSYTVFFGKSYEGEFTERDLMELRKLFHYRDVDCTVLYRFISQMMGIFLSGQTIMETKDRKYYVRNTVKKSNTRAVNLYMVLEDLFESILMLQTNAQSEVDC